MAPLTFTDQAALRWYDYVFADESDASVELWQAAILDKRTLLVCGAGFDPRTLDVPRRIASEGLSVLDVLALRPGAGGEHADASKVAEANESELLELFGARLTVVDAPPVEDPAAAGTKLIRLLQGDHHVLEYETVIVDMSGLPSSMSFSLLQLFLNQSAAVPKQGDRFVGDLLVTVSQDTSTDNRIVASGLDSPGYLSSFARLPENQGTRIWVPVLGAGASEELKALATHLEPSEICPVVPFPAKNPRMADELLIEHRDLLVGELQFETRNILYASERNPFDLYRQLVWLAKRYREALKPLGEAILVASEHTSKILSLGVLLAAHEANIVIGHVRATAYRLDGDEPPDRAPSISTAWLVGQPYA